MMPSRKWFAAQFTMLVGLAVMFLTGDTTVTDSEIIATGTWLVQAVTSWLVPNAPVVAS